MNPNARILIVDDESRMCQSLASLLSERGHEVFTAESGIQALPLIEQTIFDIALFDLMLPDMFGYELIKPIQEKNSDVFVIMMTGNASVDSAVEALRKGAYDYLRKPFDFAELFNTIQNALSQKQLKIENQAIHRKLDVSQTHYQYLVDNSPDIIYTLDPKGFFTFVNHSIETITGLKPADIIGSHYSKLLGDATLESVKWVMNERRMGSRTKNWTEMQLLTFDSFGQPGKEPLLAEVKSIGMYGKTDLSVKKTFLGTHGVIRDITEKKMAEQKNDRVKAQLERAQKMETVGTLASGVAHDLNNILTSILGYPELILLTMPKDAPYRKYILQIKKSGEKASVIVKDLLTLARRRVEISEILDLDSIVNDCLSSSEYRELNSCHPDITIDINLGSQQQNIMGSSFHLSKCLMNLLTNAAESMPSGGNITISTSPCQWDANNPLKTEEYIRLTVSDTGTGISPEDIKKIFDPFYTKKRMGRSGTGLGMTIVWTTLKDHNGHIDVHSTEGEGTTFTLYFPVTTASKKTDAPSSSKLENIKGNGQSVLIVDDIFEQRQIASNILSALGYRVASAATGEEAIEYLKTHDADLILLDMVLGSGFDGLDTYREIKKIHPSSKVIIVSGLSETDRIKKALHLGVRQFVRKPYSMETIGTLIHKELSAQSSSWVTI